MSVIINNIEYSVVGSEVGGTYFEGENEYDKGFDEAYDLKDESGSDYRLLIIDSGWYLWPIDKRYNKNYERHVGMLADCGKDIENDLKWKGALNEATWL